MFVEKLDNSQQPRRLFPERRSCTFKMATAVFVETLDVCEHAMHFILRSLICTLQIAIVLLAKRWKILG
jgi:hypothetical protein